MKKYFLCLIVSFVLISTFIPTSETSATTNIENKENEINIYCLKCDKSSTIIDNAESDDKNPIKPDIIDLPSSFSWLDYMGENWATPAKDQGNCGSCWDFAAIGGLECIISIRENCARLDPDLSEQYVLSCLPRGGSCRGGNARLAYKYINRTDDRGNNCNGVVLESCMSYQADDEVECSDKCSNWEDVLIPILDYGYWYPDGTPEDRGAIKSKIMEHGPVVTTMMFTYYVHGENNLEEWGWTHSSPDDYYPYPGETNNANHQVVLVGWKDDQNIGNGGYWIVKNSCSSEWGYNGFFNIEYGSLNIDSIEIDWVEYDPELYNNWAPKVYAGGIYQSTVGEELSFDGSETVDPEEDIIDYLWDFGDGTQKNGITQTHSYEEGGIFPVSLTVTDSNGNFGVDETWVFVDKTNSPPNTPVLKGRKVGVREKEFEYTFYANDPDGDDVYYYLNWGDVYWTGTWQPWIGPYKSGEKVTLTNIWDTDGDYVVRVKAKDNYDAKSNWATLPVKIPYNKNIQYINRPILHFLKQHPNLFPLLRQLLLKL